MKKIDVSPLQKRLQYRFKNSDLLHQALTHKSAHHANNERLEFLGDAVLNCLTADYLYQQFITANEGELTRSRATLVRKATLAELAKEFGLGDYLNLGLGERRSGGFRRDSILADALEALVGAIYLDGGFEASKACVKNWFSSRLTVLKPKEQKKDPKTRLQEWLQANHKPLPVYEVFLIEGEPHEQVFYVRCEIKEPLLTVEGKGASRRIAEQQAAAKILEQIHE